MDDFLLWMVVLNLAALGLRCIAAALVLYLTPTTRRQTARREPRGTQRSLPAVSPPQTAQETPPPALGGRQHHSESPSHAAAEPPPVEPVPPKRTAPAPRPVASYPRPASRPGETFPDPSSDIGSPDDWQPHGAWPDDIRYPDPLRHSLPRPSLWSLTIPGEEDDDMLPSGYRRSDYRLYGATDDDIDFWGLDHPGAPPPQAAGWAVWDALDELDADGDGIPDAPW